MAPTMHAQNFGSLIVNRKKIVLQRKLPPTGHIEGTTFNVVVTAQRGCSQDLPTDLKSTLESLLIRDDGRLRTEDAHPDTVISCRITSYAQPQPQATRRRCWRPVRRGGLQSQTMLRYTGVLTVSFQAKDHSGHSLAADNVTREVRPGVSGVRRADGHHAVDVAHHDAPDQGRQRRRYAADGGRTARPAHPGSGAADRLPPGEYHRAGRRLPGQRRRPGRGRQVDGGEAMVARAGRTGDHEALPHAGRGRLPPLRPGRRERGDGLRGRRRAEGAQGSAGGLHRLWQSDRRQADGEVLPASRRTASIPRWRTTRSSATRRRRWRPRRGHIRPRSTRRGQDRAGRRAPPMQ